MADPYDWCCSLIHSLDMFCKVTQVNPFYLALFGAYRWRHMSLEYMLTILFSFGTCIAHIYFGAISVLICLYSRNIFSEIFSKFCKIHQLHKKSSYKMISRNLKICITNVKQDFKIITFLKNIFSLVYQCKLISDIFKQEISYLFSMSSFSSLYLLNFC